MRTTNYVYALTAMTSLVAIVATAKLQNNSVRYQPDTQPFFSLGQIDAQTIKYLYGGNSVVVGNSAGAELFGGPFVPFPTRAEAMPIVGDDIATMAAFMYGGSTPATDDVSDLTRFLYGGEGQSSTSQKSNDALESINSIMNFQPDEEAFDATNTLAAFLLVAAHRRPATKSPSWLSSCTALVPLSFAPRTLTTAKKALSSSCSVARPAML